MGEGGPTLHPRGGGGPRREVSRGWSAAARERRRRQRLGDARIGEGGG
jgi:hypothetical protein